MTNPDPLYYRAYREYFPNAAAWHSAGPEYDDTQLRSQQRRKFYGAKK